MAGTSKTVVIVKSAEELETLRGALQITNKKIEEGSAPEKVTELAIFLGSLSRKLMSGDFTIDLKEPATGVVIEDEEAWAAIHSLKICVTEQPFDEQARSPERRFLADNVYSCSAEAA